MTLFVIGLATGLMCGLVFCFIIYNITIRQFKDMFSSDIIEEE